MPAIRIKSVNGTDSCGGYFYEKGKKLRPGETVEVENADEHLATDLVELVAEKKSRKKVADEDVTA